ncbi:uncharacterized protein LOC133711607 [Rosa rugosa]|uniref:uncharacterized protein LOC133711607 n=1 Tax=Rosa rugosa TaxID=74645 RepID=UPI002B402142|nr:uncharacterized protein LOC133711607 [Rosa rugosa]
MVKLKGPGAKPPSPPHVSGELSHLEFELQVHRDETSARLDEMQATLHANFQDSMASSFANFKSVLLDEMRQLQLAQQGGTAVPQPDGTVQFGSIPSPVLQHISPPISDATSSGMARSEGTAHNPALNFHTNDVLLGFASESTTNTVGSTNPVSSHSDMHMVKLDDKINPNGKPSVEGAKPLEGGGLVPQFAGHSMGSHAQFGAIQYPSFGSQPFNTCSGTSYANMSQPFFTNSHHPSPSRIDHDPFMMTYSGPYTATMLTMSASTAPTTSSLAASQYTQAKHVSQSTMAIPTFATATTTHIVTPPYGSQFTMNPPSSQPYPFHIFPPNMYHTMPYLTPYPSQMPHVDPNLPTMKQMRLEFSVFSGGDPVEWLNKAEQYFEFYQIPEERKLSIATMHLSDKASDRWYMFRHEFPHTWQGLADLLMREFSGYNRSEYQAALARMSQTGSMENYKEQFTKLSRRAPGFPPEVLLSCFIGGLKEDIRVDVQAQKPRTLYEACELARVYETRNESHRHFARSSNHPRPTSGFHSTTPPKVPNQGQRFQNHSTARTMHAPTPHGGRRLSQAEYQDRRAKNQCFFCEEPYKPGHNCRKGQLMIMEVTQDEEDLLSVEESLDQEVPPITDIEEPLIRLHVIGDGSSSPATMQLKGLFNNKIVHVLIDSGATHNFIHPQLLKNTKVQVHQLSPLNVILASGAKMKTRGEVNIELQLQQFTFADNFYVLPVTGCEIVLGAGWLRSLGDILWNFDSMKMRFCVQGSEFLLQGETKTKATVISCKAMTRLLRKEKEAMLVQLQPALMHNVVACPHPRLQALISKYEDLFNVPTTLPPARPQDHKIELLPNTPPVSVRPYGYPHFQKAEIEKIVQELLDNGVIKPSVSPFSSPVLLVKKKDGTWRMCVDYRSLNSVTVKDKYPIPMVDELLDEVHGSTIFTKLDLRSGYHQIRMDAAAVSKTAFRTHNGHYEFLVMPFGLTNAPSTFQSVMNDVLRDYLRKFALVFFDDILVYSPTLESHLEHLEKVFQKLQQHSLQIKKSKCSFGVSSVEYLGHIISALGVSVDPAKIECIRTWTKPKTVKGLRGFLGLAGYYRKYVRNFGIIAKPLTDMLKLGGFQWTAASETAFEALKEALMNTPVLALPDFTKKFVIECDASGIGIGAILSQEGHPIAYLSKALAPRHVALSVYDKEMLAVVYAVQQWRPYLLGRHFSIYTDHRTIQYFLEQKISTPTQQKWLLKLAGYDYSIHYKAGKNNSAPDALSRKEELSNRESEPISKYGSLNTSTGISSPVHSFVSEIQAACLVDPEARDIIQQVTQNVNALPHYSITNSQLMYKGKIFVPTHDNWRDKILAEFHNGLNGGHAGRQRTFKRITRSFAWPGLHKDVKTFVACCHICQQNHYETINPPGLLQPNVIPEQAWTNISMDFIEGLPSSAGKTVIMVVIDRFTKYAHFIALNHPYTAAIVVQHFITGVFKLHGMPKSIISDRDPVFLSAFWEAFFQAQGTSLNKSSAYHPQTDGQTENLNRTLEQYLRCVVGEKPHSWVTALPWAEYWYNTAHHSAIGMTPFQALYGYEPPTITLYSPGSTAVEAVDQQLQTRDELLAVLKRNLQVAQARMKQFYDKKHTERVFAEGDWVYLKLQPYRQQSVERRSVPKLAPRYYGPYQVEKRIGSVAYKLKLPPSARVHPVFHVSLLKKKIGDAAVVSAHLPPNVDPHNPRWYPAAILDRRMFKKGNAPVTKWLIQWLGSSVEEATWEEADELLQRFPDFQA